MNHRNKMAIPFLCMICLGVISFPPHGAGPLNFASADTAQMIEEMEYAPPRDRGKKALALARDGDAEEAIPLLVELIEEYLEHKDMDTHFIVGAVQALTHMGSDARDDATAPLLELLDSLSRELRYVAALALGRIWEGEGPEESETVREINTLLLSSLETAEGAERYGPALALTRINADTGITNPESAEPDVLEDEVLEWFFQNRNRLLEPEERPWPLLMRDYLRAPDSQEAEEARALIIERKPLRSVDYLAEALLAADAEDAIRDNLADMLGEVSGVGIDISEARQAEEIREVVHQWRGRWHEELKTRKDQEHRDYTWWALEKAVRQAKTNAYPEDFEHLQAIKEVVINQYDTGREIPDDASRLPRELVAEHLQH